MDSDQATSAIREQIEMVGKGRPCNLELRNITSNPKYIRVLENLMK